MVSLVNSHTNVTSKRWHLWEIDLRFALNSTPGWLGLATRLDTPASGRARLKDEGTRARVECGKLLGAWLVGSNTNRLQPLHEVPEHPVWIVN